MLPRSKLNIFLLTLVLATFAGNVWAQCIQPTANDGTREYFNHTYNACILDRWITPYCPDAAWSVNLKRYWKLDEASGDPYDSVNGNTTTVSWGGGFWVPSNGYRDGSAYFDSASTYINAGGNTTTDIDNLFTSNGLSISAWIIPVSLGENNNGTIVSKNNGTGATPANGWTFRLTGTNQLEFVVDYAGTDLVRRSVNNVITIGAWNQVVLTWNGNANASNVHIYVNNAEVSYSTGSGGLTTNGTSTRSSDAASDMIIGNNRVATLDRTFSGAIDEVYIFNGIVSAGDRESLYSHGCDTLDNCANAAMDDGEIEYGSNNHYEFCDGLSVVSLGCPEVSSVQAPDTSTDPPTAGLLGWWKLDETSGTFADSSGNGWTGTNINGTGYAPTTGYIGGAAYFNPNDANNDDTKPHIRVSRSFDIPSMPFTMSAWVKPTDYNDWRSIVGKRDAGYGANVRFHWAIASGAGYIYVDGNNGSLYFYNYLVPTNVWTHLAVVLTTDASYLYVNGALADVAGPIGGLGAGGANAYFNIGDNGETDTVGYNSDGDPFKGYLDDIRIYSGALTATEINNIYNYSLENGMALRLRLDETSGTSATDATGHGYTGTLTGGTAWSPGPHGGRLVGAADFDGIDDYIDLTSTASNVMRNISAASVSMWVWPDTEYSYGLIGFSTGGTGAPNAVSRFTIESLSDGMLEVGGRTADGDSLGYAVTDYQAIKLGRWNHIVGVVDYAHNSVYIYANGELLGSTTTAGFTQTTTANTASDSVAVGAEDNGANIFFDGKIDDVRVFDRALNAGEVQQLFRQPGIYGWWKLDESSGNAADSSGRGYTGTPVNSPVWAPTGGKVDGAAQFPAVNGNADETQPHIDIGTDFDMGTVPFTMAAWVNPTDYVDWRTIFGKRSVPSGNGRFHWLLNNSTGNVIISGRHFTYVPPTSQWTHLAVVAKTTGSDLYVNGVLQESIPDVAYTDLNDIGGHANIGDNGENDSYSLAPGYDGDPYKGSIDDMRVYDRPLSPGEIKGIFNLGRPDNLVAWWKLDENNGSTAVDSVGGFNCGMYGTPTIWLPDNGAVGGALWFDGTNDYCEYVDPGTIALDFTTGGITIAGWAYAESGYSGQYRNLIVKGNSGVDYNFGLQLNSSDQIHFFYSNALGFHEYASTAAQYYPNQWVHYAFTYTYGTGSSAKLYVNGILVPGSWITGNGNALGLPNNSHVLLGASSSGAYEPWIGALDDIRVYNTVLTQAQITQLYKSTTPGECNSLGVCSNTGAIEYDDAISVLKWCNGSMWLPMAKY